MLQATQARLKLFITNDQSSLYYCFLLSCIQIKSNALLTGINNKSITHVMVLVHQIVTELENNFLQWNKNYILLDIVS